MTTHLTPEERTEIIRLFVDEKLSIREISTRVGRSGSAVQKLTASVAPQGIARGTAHYCAKLNEDKVRDIRRRQCEGVAVLAKEFGVTRPAVLDVLKGRTWKHVE